MMDLRVPVVLLFVFLTEGYSLRCYPCMPDSTGSCDATVETCPVGSSKCEINMMGKTVGAPSIWKRCAAQCDSGTRETDGGPETTHCCDTDRCNAADGVSKGSFLLLFSPLLFYFLFQ